MAFDPAGNLDVLDYARWRCHPTVIGRIQSTWAMYSSAKPDRRCSIQLRIQRANDPPRISGRHPGRREHRTDSRTPAGLVSTVNTPIWALAARPFLPISPTPATKTSTAIQPTRESVPRPFRSRAPGSTILASTPVYQTGFAGVEVTYPLNETTTATGLQQPQAVAISGLNKTVYVADSQAGKVYSTQGSGGQRTDSRFDRNHHPLGADRAGPGWSRQPVHR